MESTDLLTMSNGELDRLSVVERIIERRLTLVDGGKQLGITARQMGRLVKAFKSGGTQGLISKKRGKRRNRVFPEGLKQSTLAIITDQYGDLTHCDHYGESKFRYLSLRS